MIREPYEDEKKYISRAADIFGFDDSENDTLYEVHCEEFRKVMKIYGNK